jgi:hypothetical protein
MVVERRLVERYYEQGHGARAQAHVDIARVRGGASFDHPDFPGFTIETAPLWSEP